MRQYDARGETWKHEAAIADGFAKDPRSKRIANINFQDCGRRLYGQHFIELEDGRQVSEFGNIADNFGLMRLVSR